MDIVSKLRYHRTSPRKVRLVADLVRGKEVQGALSQLMFAKKKSSPVVAKIIKSAVSSARHNYKIDTDKTDLYIKEIRVDEGPARKRFNPVWRGMAHPYKKRTSHITVVLSERQKSEAPALPAGRRSTKSKKHV